MSENKSDSKLADDTIKRVNIDFPLWMLRKIDRIAKRYNVHRQALLKIWIAQILEKRSDDENTS